MLDSATQTELRRVRVEIWPQGVRHKLAEIGSPTREQNPAFPRRVTRCRQSPWGLQVGATLTFLRQVSCTTGGWSGIMDKLLSPYVRWSPKRWHLNSQTASRVWKRS